MNVEKRATGFWGLLPYEINVPITVLLNQRQTGF